MRMVLAAASCLLGLILTASPARALSCSPGCGDVLCRGLDTIDVEVVEVGTSEMRVEVVALDAPRGDVAVGDRLPMFTFIVADVGDRLLARVENRRAFGVARIVDVGGVPTATCEYNLPSEDFSIPLAELRALPATRPSCDLALAQRGYTRPDCTLPEGAEGGCTVASRGAGGAIPALLVALGVTVTHALRRRRRAPAS